MNVPFNTPVTNEEQAARFLGVTMTTLRRWRHLGKGPEYLKLGTRAIRYEVSALEEFVVACRENTKAGAIRRAN
jgi:hypothetical protein